jgi:hypothetical protein
MAGPNFQVPSAYSEMFEIQYDEEGKTIAIALKPQWAALFQSLQQTLFASSRNGSTSVRPTEAFKGRYEGMPFFDRTLGLPVFLKHASSNVWVKADGTIA